VDYDPNVNVRLAALDALHQSASNNMVREGLDRVPGAANVATGTDSGDRPLVEIARGSRPIPVTRWRANRRSIRQVRERAQWALGVLK